MPTIAKQASSERVIETAYHQLFESALRIYCTAGLLRRPVSLTLLSMLSLRQLEAATALLLVRMIYVV